MIIKEVHKFNRDGFIHEEVVIYNQYGLKISETSSGKCQDYFYDEKNRLVRVERTESSDDPNSYETKYRDDYVYSGYDFRVITYETHNRAINDDSYPIDQITAIREVKYEGQNKILDKTNHLRHLHNVEYSQYKYSNNKLIYEECHDIFGTYKKKEYLNNRLILEEEKVIAHWEENSPDLFLKKVYKYVEDEIVEEEHYINNTHSVTIRNSYVDKFLVKKINYNIINGVEVIRNYTTYLYSSNDELIKREVYEHYVDHPILCEYEEFENEEIEQFSQKKSKCFTNEEYSNFNSSFNIDYSRCNSTEYWSEKFKPYGIKLNKDEINNYIKKVTNLFLNWTFDLTSERIELKNSKGDLIKEVHTKPIGADENATTLINHYEYNEKDEIEFILKINWFGIIDNLSKYYYK